VNPVERGVRRIDHFQQTHRPLAIGFGVVKKFGDDRAGALAALIAYYGFLAVFPLLLLLTTVLGFVMDRNSALRASVLNSALRDFPIIGPQLGQAIHPLKGSAFGLAFGVGGLIWGSLGVTQACQLAMAEVWNIPGVERPPFVTRLLWGVELLTLLAGGLVATTVIASVSAIGGGVVTKAAGVVLSLALNMGLFALAFRVLTVKKIPTRSLLPGALLGGIGWSLLQMLGGYLVGHQLRHASQVYGYFASVLGLVSWIFLSAQLTLYAAEANVVWARRLWPRSIVQPPLTEADKRASTTSPLPASGAPSNRSPPTGTATQPTASESHPSGVDPAPIILTDPAHQERHRGDLGSSSCSRRLSSSEPSSVWLSSSEPSSVWLSPSAPSSLVRPSSAPGWVATQREPESSPWSLSLSPSGPAEPSSLRPSWVAEWQQQ